jgi:hypothetical protein
MEHGQKIDLWECTSYLNAFCQNGCIGRSRPQKCTLKAWLLSLTLSESIGPMLAALRWNQKPRSSIRNLSMDYEERMMTTKNSLISSGKELTLCLAILLSYFPKKLKKKVFIRLGPGEIFFSILAPKF